MDWRVSLAAAAGLAVASLVLVRFPRALFIEAGEQPHSPRVEAAMAGIMTLAGLAVLLSGLGPSWPARIAAAVVVMAAIGIIYSDLRFLIIPDLYSLAIAAAAVASPLRLSWFDIVLGALACGGLLGGLAWFWKTVLKEDGMGLGDVKLAAALGALLGAGSGMIVIAISAMLAAAPAIVMRRLGGEQAEAQPLIPYGAALGGVGAVWLLWSMADIPLGGPWGFL